MRWLAPRGVSEDMNMDSSGGSTAKDSGLSSPPWPLSKVRFRTADDFGCADWEWLFRHHQLDALVSSRFFPLMLSRITSSLVLAFDGNGQEMSR